MSTWKEDNVLKEKLRNSDYIKIIKLVNSENPRYCFGLISACRGLNISKKIASQKMIDDNNNHRNKVNSQLLSHELNANYLPFMEVVGYYPEEGKELAEEASFFVYTIKDEEDKLRNILIELARVFKQDSIMFIDAKTHTPQYIWTGEGDTLNWIEEKNKEILHFDFSQDSLDKIFTRVGTRNNGRRFQLKENSFSNNIATRVLYYRNPAIIDYNRFEEDGYLEFFEKSIKRYII